jgi:hypothetical protein
MFFFAENRITENFIEHTKLLCKVICQVMLEIWRLGLVVVIFKAYNVMGKFYNPFSPPIILNPWFV